MEKFFGVLYLQKYFAVRCKFFTKMALNSSTVRGSPNNFDSLSCVLCLFKTMSFKS